MDYRALVKTECFGCWSVIWLRLFLESISHQGGDAVGSWRSCTGVGRASTISSLVLEASWHLGHSQGRSSGAEVRTRFLVGKEWTRRCILEGLNSVLETHAFTKCMPKGKVECMKLFLDTPRQLDWGLADIRAVP